METAIIIISIIAMILSGITLVVLYSFIKKNKETASPTDNKEVLDAIKEAQIAITTESKAVSSVLSRWAESASNNLETRLNSFEGTNRELNRTVDSKLEGIKETVDKKIASFEKSNNEQLDKLRGENREKLDAMNSLVTEKLTETLNARVSESFENISKLLKSITAEFTKMEALSGNVTDLTLILQNARSRGDWGEETLEMIVSEILPQEHFEIQSNYGGLLGQQAVDIAVKLPSGSDSVYLPIDAKFPVEDYKLILECRAKGNTHECEKSIKALESAIKYESKSISSKYIKTPLTTDFAIMFLPSEGLYAEVMNIKGLSAKVRQENKIIIAGPSNVSAIMQSLRMGFKTLQIQKSSSMIMEQLVKFIKQFDEFSNSMRIAEDYIDKAAKKIRETANKTEKIKTRINELGKIEAIRETEEKGFIE